MKKNISRVIVLLLTVMMIFSASACAISVTVSYDEKTLDSLESLVNVQATAAPVTAAPTQAPTAAPTQAPTEAPTQAPSTDPAAPTDAPATDPAAASTEPAAPTGSMPTGTDAIANFYKDACARIKDNAEAGYVKKEWQTITDLNITGIGMVDSAIGNVVAGYMTTEDECEPQNSAKGSDDAKNRFPGFTLTDYTKIASAECTQNPDGNYHIKIVMADEDTPKKSGSFLSEATNSLLFWEDIEAELANVSIVKGYDNVHIMYKGYLIECDITPDGKFVSMDQTANVDIQIGSAKILVATLENKGAVLTNFVTYRDFAY